MVRWININGDLHAPEEAFIPALDHGFLYGESVYETMRTYRGVVFLLDRHLRRLSQSAEALRLPLSVGLDRLGKEVERTVEQPGFAGDVRLRIALSRGSGPIGMDLDLAERPTFIIYAGDLPPRPPHWEEEGTSVAITSVERLSPRALDPRIKSGNFLQNLLAFREARALGAEEGILLHGDGTVAEGASSNVFIVRGGEVLTPEAQGILRGITREVVLELAGATGIRSREEDFRPEDLLAAEEAFLTSSLREVVAIGRVGDRPIGPGRAGPVTRRLRAAYREFVEQEIARRGGEGAA